MPIARRSAIHPIVTGVTASQPQPAGKPGGATWGGIGAQRGERMTHPEVAGQEHVGVAGVRWRESSAPAKAVFGHAAALQLRQLPPG